MTNQCPGCEKSPSLCRMMDCQCPCHEGSGWRLCPDDHTNFPTAGRCRVCSTLMEPETRPREDSDGSGKVSVLP